MEIVSPEPAATVSRDEGEPSEAVPGAGAALPAIIHHRTSAMPRATTAREGQRRAFADRRAGGGGKAKGAPFSTSLQTLSWLVPQTSSGPGCVAIRLEIATENGALNTDLDVIRGRCLVMLGLRSSLVPVPEVPCPCDPQ